MKNSELHFESLKESRGWYFVEYAPPIAGNPFALVQLTILSESDATDSGRIATAMEQELCVWLERYGVPLMVSSFDAKGDLISLNPSSHLMGRKNERGEMDKIWGLFESKDLPPLSSDILLSIYDDISYRTSEDIRAAADLSFKRNKQGFQIALALLIFWLVVVPVTIELLGFANPIIGVIVLIYSLWKAFVQLMKLLGEWPEGWKEKEQSERKRIMEHYFWHCERNPEGFQRLKTENFNRETRRQTASEAATLKTK